MPAKKAAKKTAKKAVKKKAAKKAVKRKANREKPLAALLKNVKAAPASLIDELPEEFSAAEGSVEWIFQSLPARQQRFVLEYFACGLNATQAAIKAGYSAHTADSQASRLLKDEQIAAVVAELSKRQLEKLEISADRVLQGIARMAFADVRKLFTPDGKLIPIRELDDITASMIAGVEYKAIHVDGVEIGGLTKIKLSDRRPSLEALGRHLKLFTDTVEHKGNVGLQLIHDIPRPVRGKTKET